MAFVNFTGGRFVLDGGQTASVKMGPFLSEDDGKTVLDSLSMVQADVRLSKNDGDFALKTDTGAPTHDENGWYDVPIDATDTDTQGNLLIAIHATGALPVWRMVEVRDVQGTA